MIFQPAGCMSKLAGNVAKSLPKLSWGRERSYTLGTCSKQSIHMQYTGMYISYSFLFDYIVYIIFYYLNSYSIIRRCSILLRTQLTYTTYIWISCLHLPAKHWSSKCSNKLAMAGHNSKIAMAENPTVFWWSQFWGQTATSNPCRNGIRHTGSPSQWLGSRYPSQW